MYSKVVSTVLKVKCNFTDSLGFNFQYNISFKLAQLCFI
jgi:hypothetical protein